METPHAFNVLVQSLKDRKKYNDPPYSLLLSSTIVLTPDVLQEICDARDWNSFSDFIQDRPLADRISMLRNHLDISANQERFRALAQLVKEGYFTTIFTTSPDSGLEEELSSLHPKVLVVGKDSVDYIASELSRTAGSSNSICIVKLHGSSAHNVLSEKYPRIYELPERIKESIKHYLNKDMIVIGSAERESDITRLFEQEGDAIYYVLPEMPTTQDVVFSTIEARVDRRSDAYVISGPYGQFETFCVELLNAVHATTRTIAPTSTPLPPAQKPQNRSEHFSTSVQDKPWQKPSEPQETSRSLVAPVQSSLAAQPPAPASTVSVREEHQSSEKNIVTRVFLAVIALGVLLAEIAAFIKLAPSVNSTTLILLIIVLVVTVLGIMNILSGNQITQILTQVTQAITSIWGPNSSSSDKKEGSTDATSAVTSNNPDMPTDAPSPVTSDKPDPAIQPQLPPEVITKAPPKEPVAYPQPPKPEPSKPVKIIDYPTAPGNKTQEEQDAISLVTTCFAELMKWKKAVDFAAFSLFAGGEILPDEQYSYQHAFLEKICSLSSNLNTYIEHLPKNIHERSAPLLGSIYNIQTTARLLQIYVTQSNRPSLQGEIQPQFKSLSNHFTFLEENFKKLDLERQ